MESLQQSLSSLSELFQKRMANFEAALPNVQGTSAAINLTAEFTSFRTFIVDVLNNFQQQLDMLAGSVDAMEMRTRRKLLLLHGIAEEKSEDTSQVVVSIVKRHLGLANFFTKSIRRCHRMGRSSTEHKARPILIKFESMSIRDSLWFSKTKFKGSGITVSEFLTKQRYDAFMAARERFGVSHSWTKESVIYIVPSSGTLHRITTLSEPYKIKEQDAEKPAVASKPPAKSKKNAAQRK